ncbi:MAG TPA: tripartite tricarboxylate transporter substrate binding protein [Burkholderiales bacterium]|nr:tripartite tricarboxylate transporter substrate binding protein [Burkholderiales bacterium]
MTQRDPMRLLLIAIALAAAAALPSAVNAQAAYPARPIRVLIPFPAGGAADTIARTVGEQMAQQFGQPVVMDNRPGAGGRLATEMLAHAEPDGYTLLLGTVGSIAVSPALYRKLPYDPQRDILPVTQAGDVLSVMVVHPGMGVATVQQFIEWAKQRQGQVRFGSSGTGQPDHVAGELFQRLTGVHMTHVPYKGGGPALVDLIAGDLQVMFATYVVAVPHIRSGRLKAVATTAPKRQPLLGDLPAVSETVPGFGFTNWNGVFAPGRTPGAIADRLHAAVNNALQAPEVRKRQQGAGIEPVGSATRAEFAQFVREDTARWAKLVREAHIQVE